MNNMTLTAGQPQSAQVAHIVPFTAVQRNGAPELEPFSDNFDHLQALEHEARLITAVAFLRRGPWKNGEDEDNANENNQRLYPLPADATLDDARSLLAMTAATNRRREELSLRRGIRLSFSEFCAEWRLEEFERKALLLLLMRFTAPAFAKTLVDCRFAGRHCSSMEIGALLDMLCDNLREQLACRRFFSIRGTLIAENIIVMRGEVDSDDNILEMYINLHERIARHIVGDNNHYNSVYRFIRREKSCVRLEQVIMPEELKGDIVRTVSRYLHNRATGTMDTLDDFFGYGTGMVLLLHGPSGTGKTMLARGLATHCNRDLITFQATDMRDIRMGDEEILAALFREAALHNAIVLLDECDDVFENNTRASRALLLEIEKARCVVILATNKPVDLDPAMERRITMKVPFSLPDTDLRLRMWRALLPAMAVYADDVDLTEVAENYHFTGGLIKNSLLMALNYGVEHTERQGAVITRKALEYAAGHQALPMGDMGWLCRQYTPRIMIENLCLRSHQRESLRNMVKAYQRLRNEAFGLNLLVGATDISTGIKAVEALAGECGLKVREYDYASIVSLADDKKVIDPLTQKKVTPMQYAFSAGTGDACLTLFVDHEGAMTKILESGEGNTEGIHYVELLGYLRQYRGFFCMVTGTLPSMKLPMEFNLRFDLEYPSEEFQVKKWEELLGRGVAGNSELTELAVNHPMHATEIEFVVRQAMIRSIINGKSVTPSLPEVYDVISEYRRKSRVPLLFGNGR